MKSHYITEHELSNTRGNFSQKSSKGSLQQAPSSSDVLRSGHVGDKVEVVVTLDVFAVTLFVIVCFGAVAE